MKDKIKKSIYILFFLTPLVMGFISYMCDGKNISDALYYSISLYGFNFEKSESPSLCLEIARWMAPLVTATSILVVAKSFFAYFYVCILALRRDSNIVYGDSDFGKAFCDIEKKAIHCEKKFVAHGKNHFIMYESDIDNFSFLKNNLKFMADKNVYVCMNELDSTMLNSELSNNMPPNVLIKFFQPNDVIARTFWKEQQLWKLGKPEWKIAIVGFESLGKKLLERALLLNLFDTNQKIEYYIFGDCKRFELTHASMSLMNSDKILYFDKDSMEQWRLYQTMDMIIVTEEMDVDLMQSILGCSSSETKIFYYSPNDDDINKYIATERLVSYGYNNNVFTLNNIKTDVLYENAIALNNIYQEKYNGPNWESLSGFAKESNVSAADYGVIIQNLIKKEMPEEELAQLEHNRWCRFHFLHYWRYGIPKNKMNKDETTKIHQLLISYKELSQDDKDKVKEVIHMWKQLL